MKDTKTNEAWAIAASLCDEITQYIADHEQKSDIEYALIEDPQGYRIKIIKDPDGLLRRFLDNIEQE